MGIRGFLLLANNRNGSLNDLLHSPFGNGNGLDNGTTKACGKCGHVNFGLFLFVNVRFVQGNHHGNAKLKQLRCKKQTAAQVGSIHNVDDHIGVLVFNVFTCYALFGGEGRHGVCTGKVDRN